MAMNAPCGWLVTYDIANPRRLARLHRFMVKQATPIQYSVFHFEGSPGEMGRLIKEIEAYIDPRADDVRAYALPTELSIDTYGKGKSIKGTSLLSSCAPYLQKLLQATAK